MKKIRIVDIGRDDPHYPFRDELIGGIGRLGIHSPSGEWMSFEFRAEKFPKGKEYAQVGEIYFFYHAKYEEVK